MPPRIPVPPRLNGVSLCFRPAQSSTAHIQIANATTFAERKAHKDPYALAQSAQRKTVNLARQKILQEERRKALGDPVRGITTPFIESFDDVSGSASVLLDALPSDGTQQRVQVRSGDDIYLNHYVKASELAESLAHSYELTEPSRAKIMAFRDPAIEAADKKAHDEGHERAVTALARIVSLANAGQADKTRANTQRCVETFGRHTTDSTLRPRAPVNPDILGGKELPAKTPRAGPDTGSSEVQIAILTAKIRVLATKLEEKGGTKDKINKRNLRVMVHKRQKLLRYLRGKERGSDRWENLVGTLGLTEGHGRERL
ncbi:30S ribosomal protein S15, partial [Lachnellula occidentalis]